MRPKCVCGRGSAPNPTGGAYSAPPDPLAGGEGAAAASPRTPPPLLPSTWLPHFGIASAATAPDLTLASPVDELIYSTCRLQNCVWVFVSSRPRNRIGLGFSVTGPGRAGPGLIFSVRAGCTRSSIIVSV